MPTISEERRLPAFAVPLWRVAVRTIAIPFRLAWGRVGVGCTWLRVRKPHIEMWAFPQRKWGAPGVCLGSDGWEKRLRIYLGRPSTAHYGPPYFYSRIIFERTWRTRRKPSVRWGVFDY